jgi:hypothetical protein
MGRNFATELINSDIDLKTQLVYHLQGNHYPPIPLSMVQPCIYAIEACNEECYNRMIELPEGISWRGQSSAPAHAIVEGHHLDAWLHWYQEEQEIE